MENEAYNVLELERLLGCGLLSGPKTKRNSTVFYIFWPLIQEEGLIGEPSAQL